MSYDTSNEYFADATFNITSQNFDPATGTTVPYAKAAPTYDGTALLTQNSFTYLEQVIGDRPDDGLSHVVHSASVDPNHFTAPTATTLTLSSVGPAPSAATGRLRGLLAETGSTPTPWR